PPDIFGGWSGRPGVAQTRPAKQPQAWRDLPGHGAEPGARTLRRFRTHAGGGKTERTSRSADRRRDTAAMDDGGGAVGRTPPQTALPASAATTEGMSGRTRADRRFRASLVREPWRDMYSAGVRRRRDQPTDAAAVRQRRFDLPQCRRPRVKAIE